MQRMPLAAHQQNRVAACLPFVESLARRMASTMPHSIDLSDLVQDGVIGLIDAAHRFDEARGIKFDVAYREIPAIALKIAYLTDPVGTYIELTEGYDEY